jgi:hypothetical protein
MSNQEHGASLERNLLLFMAINMLLLRSKEGNAGFSRASNSRILKNVPA